MPTPSSLRLTRLSPVALLPLLTAFLACAGEPVGAGQPAPRPFAVIDPAADTLPTSLSDGEPAVDIVGIDGEVTGTTIQLRLTFAEPVAPWSAQQANSLDGFVDFDLDQSETTGIPAAIDEYGGSAGMGAEYYLSLRDFQPGRVGLVRVATGTGQGVAAVFAGRTVTVTIPRNLLTADDGNFGVSAVVGHPTREATDFAPNAGHYVIPGGP